MVKTKSDLATTEASENQGGILKVPALKKKKARIQGTFTGGRGKIDSAMYKNGNQN